MMATETSKSMVVPPGIAKGPDLETKPDYENIHGPLGKTLDSVFLSIFRTEMAEKVGVDSSLPKVSLDSREKEDSLRFWTGLIFLLLG
jgi:hypothetical protein